MFIRRISSALRLKTGYSFEYDNIRAWLSNGNICPVTRRKLKSKKTVSNKTLKLLIGDWQATGTWRQKVRGLASKRSSTLFE